MSDIIGPAACAADDGVFGRVAGIPWLNPLRAGSLSADTPLPV